MMRHARLLSILILLQVRGRQTAETLAAEFEVSVRTIYRDVDALSAAGVPVYGDRGHGGGFQLLDGYRTNLTGLDSAEAEAMLLIGLPEQATQLGVGEAAERARRKLIAALPARRSAGAQRIAARFHFDSSDWYRSQRPRPFLVDAARAVLDDVQIVFDYRSWTSQRRWQVDPLGLVLKAGNWYLVASDRKRIAMFNVADMTTFMRADLPAERPPGFELSRWWTDAVRDFEKRLRTDRAILRVSAVGLERIGRLGRYAQDAIAKAEVPGQDGSTIVSLPIESVGDATKILLPIAAEFDVIAPESLREALLAEAQAIVERMGAGGRHMRDDSA